VNHEHGKAGILQRTKKEIRDAVVGYLTDRPQAMDSLEGISTFWLARHRVKVEVELLHSILEELVAEGFLEGKGRGARRRYHLRRTGES